MLQYVVFLEKVEGIFVEIMQINLKNKHVMKSISTRVVSANVVQLEEQLGMPIFVAGLLEVLQDIFRKVEATVPIVFKVCTYFVFASCFSKYTHSHRDSIET